MTSKFTKATPSCPMKDTRNGHRTGRRLGGTCGRPPNKGMHPEHIMHSLNTVRKWALCQRLTGGPKHEGFARPSAIREHKPTMRYYRTPARTVRGNRWEQSLGGVGKHWWPLRAAGSSHCCPLGQKQTKPKRMPVPHLGMDKRDWTATPGHTAGRGTNSDARSHVDIFQVYTAEWKIRAASKGHTRQHSLRYHSWKGWTGGDEAA